MPSRPVKSNQASTLFYSAESLSHSYNLILLLRTSDWKMCTVNIADSKQDDRMGVGSMVSFFHNMQGVSPNTSAFHTGVKTDNF